MSQFAPFTSHYPFLQTRPPSNLRCGSSIPVLASARPRFLAAPAGLNMPLPRRLNALQSAKIHPQPATAGTSVAAEVAIARPAVQARPVAGKGTKVTLLNVVRVLQVRTSGSTTASPLLPTRMAMAINHRLQLEKKIAAGRHQEQSRGRN